MLGFWHAVSWEESHDSTLVIRAIFVLQSGYHTFSAKKISFNTKALSFRKGVFSGHRKKDNDNAKPHQSSNNLDLMIIKKWICSIKLHKPIVFVLNYFMHNMFKPW